jgi:hypothetical protein
VFDGIAILEEDLAQGGLVDLRVISEKCQLPWGELGEDLVLRRK